MVAQRTANIIKLARTSSLARSSIWSDAICFRRIMV